MVEVALSKIRETLAADGFKMKYETTGQGVLNVLIVAEPGACVECLVPEPILVDMLNSELKEHGLDFQEINICID